MENIENEKLFKVGERNQRRRHHRGFTIHLYLHQFLFYFNPPVESYGSDRRYNVGEAIV